MTEAIAVSFIIGVAIGVLIGCWVSRPRPVSRPMEKILGWEDIPPPPGRKTYIDKDEA